MCSEETFKVPVLISFLQNVLALDQKSWIFLIIDMIIIQ